MKRLLAFLIIPMLFVQATLAYPFFRNTASLDGNLITNGDFEAGDTEDWIYCGGAAFVDAQAPETTAAMVHTGRYALRLGQPIDNSCGNDALGPAQIAAEDITIPSDASDLTLSFWYSAVGDWPAGEVSIQLSTKPTNNLGSQAFISSLKMDDLMPGWQLFRQNLNVEDIERVRGETLYLTCWVQSRGQPNWNWAIHLDDVRVAPTWERTQAAGLPGDLRGDGAQPLLVGGLGTAEDTYGMQRMDTDGSNRVVLAESLLQPEVLTWSPDGARIAFQTTIPYPDSNNNPDTFPALVSRVSTINGDGSGARDVFYTTGVEGQKEQPRGCLPTRTCADPGRDAIDVTVEDMAWSPDGSQIVSTMCTEGRWYNGDKEISGCSYYLALHPLPNGDEEVNISLPPFIDVAQHASWAANNQLLFQRPPSISTDADATGVWEVDMTQPPNPQLVQTWLTGYASSNSFDLRPSPEQRPTWAPDSRHFVTYRVAQGVRYIDDPNDFFGGLRANYTIMLHDRQDPAATRMLLYVDQGSLIGRPTWSPDGRYLLYVLLSDERTSADIWWLDVASGATGRVTNDGVSYEVDWQPTHTLPQRAPAVTPNPALTQKVYLPQIANAPAAAQPPAVGGNPVTFPTVVPTSVPPPLPAPVDPTAVPPRGISGQVLYQGAPVAGITVQLETCLLEQNCEVRARATTDANGAYNFPYVPTYSGIYGYQVTYRNSSDGDNAFDDRYLQVWQEPIILDYDYAQRVPGGTFDIANVVLTAPGDGAKVATPTTFSWQSRGVAGDQYQWFLDALFDSGLCDQQEPGMNTSFLFETRDCSFPSVAANEPIIWYVLVQAERGGAGISQPRTVVFKP